MLNESRDERTREEYKQFDDERVKRKYNTGYYNTRCPLCEWTIIDFAGCIRLSAHWTSIDTGVGRSKYTHSLKENTSKQNSVHCRHMQIETYVNMYVERRKHSNRKAVSLYALCANLTYRSVCWVFVSPSRRLVKITIGQLLPNYYR